MAAAALNARQLCQRHIVERPADGAIDALPGMPDAAIRFDATAAVLAAALRDRKRAFQCVENLRRSDLGRRLRQLIAAMTAAGRHHQAAALQRFQ